MRLKSIMNCLERLSPLHYAEEWDNVGLLVGDENQEIQRIMVALDASDYVIDKAVEVQADLLLTHHPMIFRPLKQVNTQSMVGRRVLKLAGNRIAYYAMHTNFDIKGGMAELAAGRLNLKEQEPLDVTVIENGIPQGIGRVGMLPEEQSVRNIAALVKEKFDLENVILYGEPEQKVRKIAICPGSGKSEIENAQKAGAELLITGDIGHHEGIDAVDCGLPILDATHYGLEHIFIAFMVDYLKQCQAEIGELEIIGMDTGSPITIL